MLHFFRKISHFSSSKRGAKIVLSIWLLAVIILSVTLPSAKDYEGSSGEGSTTENTPSEIAEETLKEQFPSKEGLPALLVFHDEKGISSETKEKITELSEWLMSEEKPEEIISSLPYHQFSDDIQKQMYSEDESTLLFNVTLEEGLESGEANDVLNTLREKVSSLGLTDIEFEITGPAGIAADTTALFKNADFVLMIATVVLIFIILIVIYRSPLLAITPLLIAGIVYGVVDRIIGFAGAKELFSIDSQAVSIMLVLLFAVLTDYSLFIFSRYREALSKHESKYTSMQEAIYHVSEPIFFSGGTVFLAMMTLFATVFKPYNHFAPVFSIAVIVILIAGLTLIPSIFALMGRRAFWPFIPKVQENKAKKSRLWTKVSEIVKKRPTMLASILLIIFLIGSANFTTINFSFNLLKSFPDDMSSRNGFELLEENYPVGELAPTTIIFETKDEIVVNDTFKKEMKNIIERINELDGIEAVSPEREALGDKLPNDFIAESNKAVKLQVILKDHPYEREALTTIKDIRNVEEDIMAHTDFDKMHIAGQTAAQLDVKEMNDRDTIVLFAAVTILLIIVLVFQTKSIILPFLMMGTILLSYFASMGFSWWIFQYIFNLDAISYRLPVYTFIFMVALGIDYNIMLVSRIREEAEKDPWKEAVARGVQLTGGVISSAGIILAATFSVLMTQPLQELFLFGFTMGIGILLDTFIIRGVFMPSLLILLFQKNK